MHNRKIGILGEDHAIDVLTSKGYKIIDRNYRTKYGEIDIISLYHNTIVFVEVKTRIGDSKGDPYEAVDNRKIKKILGVARNFVLINQLTNYKMRIDIFAITLSKSLGIQYVKHIVNVTA